MKAREAAAFWALTLIWGASYFWIKIAVQEAGPFTVVVIRLAFAVLTILGFLIARKEPIPREWRRWGVFLILGLMGMAIPWLLITWAEKTIDSALATVLNGTVPFFTLFIAPFLLDDEKMSVRRVLGLLIGFGGVLVLTQRDAPQGVGTSGLDLNMLSVGAMLLASLLYAFTNVFARRNLRGVPAVVQAFYTMLVADAVMWIVTPVVEAPFTWPSKTITWVAIIWLGTLGAGIAHMLFFYLLHAIGPTRVAMVTYTIPIVGVTLGVVILNEKLDWSLALGTVLIVSGVWGVNRR